MKSETGPRSMLTWCSTHGASAVRLLIVVAAMVVVALAAGGFVYGPDQAGGAAAATETSGEITAGLLERPEPAQGGIRTVVIDPGHGGSEIGAVGPGELHREGADVTGGAVDEHFVPRLEGLPGLQALDELPLHVSTVANNALFWWLNSGNNALLFGSQAGIGAGSPVQACPAGGSRGRSGQRAVERGVVGSGWSGTPFGFPIRVR